MKYQISERVQHVHYCCEIDFIKDVLETLLNEDLNSGCVNIIADKEITELILKTICKVDINSFEFELKEIDFSKDFRDIDEYRIILFDDGTVYVEPAIDKDADYYDCDGFIFVESEVSEDSYLGSNASCDVMVFSIGDY